MHIAGLVKKYSGFEFSVESIERVDDLTIQDLLLSFLNSAHRRSKKPSSTLLLSTSFGYQPAFQNAKKLQDSFWSFVAKKNLSGTACPMHEAIAHDLPIAIIFIRQLIAVIKPTVRNNVEINLSDKTDIYAAVLALYQRAIDGNKNITSWPSIADIQEGGSQEVSTADIDYFLFGTTVFQKNLSQKFIAILNFTYKLAEVTKIPSSIWQHPAVLAAAGSMLGMTVTGVSAIIHQGNEAYEESESAIMHPPRSWFYRQALQEPQVIGLILGVGLGIFLILFMLMYGKRWVNRRAAQASATLPFHHKSAGTELQPLLGPRKPSPSGQPSADTSSSVASSGAAVSGSHQTTPTEKEAILASFQQVCRAQKSPIIAISLPILILKNLARTTGIINITDDLKDSLAIVKSKHFRGDFCSSLPSLSTSVSMREYLHEKINHPGVAPHSSYNPRLIHQFLAAHFYIKFKEAMQTIPNSLITNEQLWLAIGFRCMAGVKNHAAFYFEGCLEEIVACYYFFHYLVPDLQEKTGNYYDAIASSNFADLRILQPYFPDSEITAVKEKILEGLTQGSIVEEDNHWRLINS